MIIEPAKPDRQTYRGYTVAAMALLALILVACAGCGGKQGADGNEKTIPYEVLKKEKRRGDGKLFLEVLVSEAAPKQEVMKLAESLRRQHARKFAHICIYDSREAFQRQFDETYPEKELDRHNLVVIAGDLGEEIRWIGEGRDH
jgi:hypothetical protein